MNIQSIDIPLTQWSGDCLVIGFLEDQVTLDGLVGDLNQSLSGLVADLIEEASFKGKSGEQVAARLAPAQGIRHLVLLGLGKAEKLSLEDLRKASAAGARYGKKHRCTALGFQLPAWKGEAVQSVQAIAEGAELALHQDQRFKSEPNGDKPEAELERLDILGLGQQVAAIERAKQVCQGVILARELVNAPANVVTPVALAQTARAIAEEMGMSLTVLDRAACEDLKMGAYLGVAQASDMPPQFIHLTYSPPGTPRRKLAIIGKGLTFDSGGLNLKPTGSGIETMKMDMAGSAATLGAAQVIGFLQPEVEVHFIVAATENMISGKALHPGDILTASNGKTIEINNTDAEGRLTLADALVYAEKLGVDAIVDLATLTGACIIALGNDIAGLWSPKDDLAAELQLAGDQAGEKFWRMPLEESYFEGMKSAIADMKNTGPRGGGSITAALFLQQFVKETPWAHLDVAGPVWAEKESGYQNVGGTGFAVRTLVNWVLNA
ncbi:leucyl aminopeptidase [Lyngbya confervoides]|uniref:Probable cytosol aminopeptidase n=1 Tax=Lyngbya confervoides BDU141951 TaxID=1574623 RepID=A0ABD4T266_9CYAN|nr:leucyl aminopeptidase [Lyngbya confervoides]MCM1982788.1 leucyl aminopeptidase [Lyngbya confervoides BDU141951]